MTFKEAAAAVKACVDPAPVIDGRRANCNLASIGAKRSQPTTPRHGILLFASEIMSSSRSNEGVVNKLSSFIRYHDSNEVPRPANIILIKVGESCLERNLLAVGKSGHV